MKKLLILLFLSSLIYPLHAQNVAFEWVKGMRGNGADDEGRSIALDAAGNSYITGTFSGTVDFDPDAGVQNLTAVGGEDIFVQKLSPSGSLLWVKQMGGINNDGGLGIALDGNGHIYTVGYFRDTVDFDPNTGRQILTARGNSDIFIQKMDPMGNLVWVKQMGGVNADRANAIAIDGMNNLYLTGYFVGTADFDPNAGVQNQISNGGTDVFVLKLTSTGNLLWVTQCGGTNSDAARGMTVDGLGNVYTTGYFQNTADFDPSHNTFNLSSAGSTDIFIQKLTTNGTFAWAKRMGANSDESGYAIITDANNNVYTTGYFRLNVDFDPGAGRFDLNAPIRQEADIFIQKLDPNGNFVWAKQLGSDGEDIPFALAMDQDNNLYTTGHYSDTLDFDPNAGVFRLGTNGVEDIFIQKMDSSGNFIWAEHIGGPSTDYSYAIALDAQNTIHTTGFHKLTTDFDPNPTNSQPLTALGFEDIYVLKLRQPCSVPITATDVQIACNAYTWIDGITYTASNNTAMFTLTNAAGCDSVVTLDLTINNVDVSTTLNGITLVANASNASYQWLDCDTGNAAITGASSASFTPTASGNYAVGVTQNGCVDTSTCVNVMVIGVDGVQSLATAVAIYPNPTKGTFVVDLHELPAATLSIFSATGQLVQQQTLQGQGTHQLELEGTAGMYFLQIRINDYIQYSKLIKK